MISFTDLSYDIKSEIDQLRSMERADYPVEVTAKDCNWSCSEIAPHPLNFKKLGISDAAIDLACIDLQFEKLDKIEEAVVETTEKPIATS